MTGPIDYDSIRHYLDEPLGDMVTYDDLWFKAQAYIKDWLPLGDSAESIERFILFFAKDEYDFQRAEEL